jgi:hypothetical protein
MHGENLVVRTNKSSRIAMTFQTPLHGQSVFPPRQRHLVDRAMAGYAANAFVEMNAVVEVNIVWQVVHPYPRDGRIVPETISNRLQRRTVGPYLGVAIHACPGGWNPGKGTVFN